MKGKKLSVRKILWWYLILAAAYLTVLCFKRHDDDCMLMSMLCLILAEIESLKERA